MKSAADLLRTSSWGVVGNRAEYEHDVDGAIAAAREEGRRAGLKEAEQIAEHQRKYWAIICQGGARQGAIPEVMAQAVASVAVAAVIRDRIAQQAATVEPL